ncbi:MFS transporter [Miltoncostaea marina]|uniref:MFS transporter n=1 Tax=Miltoncostaea marina TaxID=2843215 RepID=UPI001C3CBBBE|nr:MFS transporter [Miltoncostaea marina]
MSATAPAVARPRADGGAIDRRGIALLASGHFVIDATVGAVPALIPVFTAIYALSDLAASMILGASLLISSAIQPFFGMLADRRATPAFLWGGVAVAAAGLALAGVAGGYAGVLACIVGSGLGIAAFHPEAARVANAISADRKATGVAWFMLGGNAGFAVGPLIAALFIPVLDARATLVFLVPGVVVAAWLHAERRRLAVPVPPRLPRAARAVRRASTGAVALLLLVTSMRTWTQFCALALVPLLLTDERGFSDQAAGFAVVAFSGAGAAGTLAGAWLADRVGGRRMLVWSMPVVGPLLAAFILLDGAPAIVPLAAAGFVLMSSFSVTVVMGQEYMPDQLALAAGLMIGFGAIGSAPPGLAIFGALADAAGREAALWGVAALPLIGGLLALALPAGRRAGEAV